MTELVTPTVGPMNVELNPVTPATAPLVDAPAPVAPEPQDEPATRGRVASPRTVLIRAMLDDTDGGLTFSTALPLIEKAGYTVDQNTFNVTKSAWKRAKHPDTVRQIAPKAAPKPVKKAKVKVQVQKVKRVVELPEVTVQEAFAFVQNAGGLAKAEATVLHGRACLKAFKALVAETAKLAA